VYCVVPVVIDEEIEPPEPKKAKETKVKLARKKKRAGFSAKALEDWYLSYLDTPEEDFISPNGIGRFLEELEIDAEHVSLGRFVTHTHTHTPPYLAQP